MINLSFYLFMGQNKQSEIYEISSVQLTPFPDHIVLCRIFIIIEI
jgi:hypothetical protein